jgi:hypothetical protein
MEGVDFEGRVMTSNVRTEGPDIGLRFSEPDEDAVSKCPGCGGIAI